LCVSNSIGKSINANAQKNVGAGSKMIYITKIAFGLKKNEGKNQNL
jgi:hypothetical protein